MVTAAAAAAAVVIVVDVMSRLLATRKLLVAGETAVVIPAASGSLKIAIFSSPLLICYIVKRWSAGRTHSSSWEWASQVVLLLRRLTVLSFLLIVRFSRRVLYFAGSALLWPEVSGRHRRPRAETSPRTPISPRSPSAAGLGLPGLW